MAHVKMTDCGTRVGKLKWCNEKESGNIGRGKLTLVVGLVLEHYMYEIQV